MRVQSLLVTQGIKVRTKNVLRLRLGNLTLWDGRALPAELKSELERETERLALPFRGTDVKEFPSMRPVWLRSAAKSKRSR
jgi:hypothetical protein